MRISDRPSRASAFLLVTAAVFAVALTGCRSSSTGERIDVSAVQRQLEGELSLELVAAGFPGRTVTVSCVGSGSDGLHYTCHINATNPKLPTQSWDLSVACGPPSGPETPRCFTNNGDALQ